MTYATASRSRPHSLHGLGCGCSMPMVGLGDAVSLPATLASPGEMVAAIDVIDRSAGSLARDITAHAQTIKSTPEGLRYYTDWQRFRSEWIAFFRDHARGTSFVTRVGPLEYASGQLAGQIRDKAAAFNSFYERYAEFAGGQPTATSHVTWREWFNSVGAQGLLVVGIGSIAVIGAVVALGYLLGNYAKVKTLSKLALNRRGGRRRRHR